MIQAVKSKHHAVGTKLSKVIKQCPLNLSLAEYLVSMVSHKFLCTLPLPLQYRLWLHCLSLMKFKTSQMLTTALSGLCTATFQMGRGVLAVSARKTLAILSPVMKSCRNPTFSWITAWHTTAVILRNKSRMLYHLVFALIFITARL